MGIDGATNITVIRSRESFFWILPLMLTSPHLSPGPRQVPLTSNIFKRRSFLEVWQLASASGLDKKKTHVHQKCQGNFNKTSNLSKVLRFAFDKRSPLAFSRNVSEKQVGRAFFGSAHYQP